jgi:hypothetical protein
MNEKINKHHPDPFFGSLTPFSAPFFGSASSGTVVNNDWGFRGEDPVFWRFTGTFTGTGN